MYCASKAVAWSLTNALRVELAPQGTLVVGRHVGYVDTAMAVAVDGPKSDPADVAAQALDAVQQGQYEVLADQVSRQIKAGLAGDVTGLYPALVTVEPRSASATTAGDR